MKMGGKGKSSGLKRKPAPKFWPLHRKEFTWVVKPNSGPHSLNKCMPLAVVLRDVLDFAETRKEAKMIAAQGKVVVDGKVKRSDDFPVGLMDIVSFPENGSGFCVLPSYKGLILNPIKEEETKYKLCRIENKTIVDGGHMQLCLHDGSNIIVKVTDSKNPKEDVYETFDTLKVALPQREVLEHIKMKEKNSALITGGKNVGKFGRIVEIEKTEGKKRKNALVTIEDENKNRCQTTLEFVFSIGEAQPVISMPEAA
jgi:small subunit ribosomal protein S4e